MPITARSAAVVFLSFALTGCASNARPTVEDPGVTLSPIQSARAYASVAQDLDASGDIIGAINAYEMARELDPVAYQWVARPLAILHTRLGQTAQADIEFRRAWRLDPHDPTLRAEWNAI